MSASHWYFAETILIKYHQQIMWPILNTPNQWIMSLSFGMDKLGKSLLPMTNTHQEAQDFLRRCIVLSCGVWIKWFSWQTELPDWPPMYMERLGNISCILVSASYFLWNYIFLENNWHCQMWNKQLQLGNRRIIFQRYLYKWDMLVTRGVDLFNDHIKPLEVTTSMYPSCIDQTKYS